MAVVEASKELVERLREGNRLNESQASHIVNELCQRLEKQFRFNSEQATTVLKIMFRQHSGDKGVAIADTLGKTLAESQQIIKFIYRNQADLLYPGNGESVTIRRPLPKDSYLRLNNPSSLPTPQGYGRSVELRKSHEHAPAVLGTAGARKGGSMPGQHAKPEALAKVEQNIDEIIRQKVAGANYSVLAKRCGVSIGYLHKTITEKLKKNPKQSAALQEATKSKETEALKPPRNMVTHETTERIFMNYESSSYSIRKIADDHKTNVRTLMATLIHKANVLSETTPTSNKPVSKKPNASSAEQSSTAAHEKIQERVNPYETQKERDKRMLKEARMLDEFVARKAAQITEEQEIDPVRTINIIQVIRHRMHGATELLPELQKAGLKTKEALHVAKSIKRDVPINPSTAYIATYLAQKEAT